MGDTAQEGRASLSLAGIIVLRRSNGAAGAGISAGTRGPLNLKITSLNENSMD